MARQQPPDQIHPILFRIEAAAADYSTEEPKLTDDDVEFVYAKLQTFYDKSAKGKDLPEPTSTVARKRELLDRILQILEERYEEGLDEHLVNSAGFQPSGFPLRNEDAIYAFGLKYLIRSVRLWRKERGKKGYLTFVKEQLAGDGT